MTTSGDPATDSPATRQASGDDRANDAPTDEQERAADGETDTAKAVSEDEEETGEEGGDDVEDDDDDDDEDEEADDAGPAIRVEEEDEEPRRPRPPDREAEALALSCQVFSDLPIPAPVLESIERVGWKAPTPVQKLCLPYTLKGRDVAGFAQTGTGKTGVFLITACTRLLSAGRETKEGDGRMPRAIVLAPTRELAMQIEDDARTIFQATGLTSLAVFGGIDYDKQAQKLRDGVDVIVATPGRLMDYIKKGVVKLTDVQIFVCDEADRMFDMGFIEDVEFFLKRIPETSQKLLFSATTNEQVKELAFEYLESPEYISVNPEVLTPERIEQQAIHVHARHKLRVIMGLLREQNPECAIIFTNTKLTADWLHYKLTNNGFEVDLITGDLPQKKRIRLIERIKEGKLKALIATDVASRGLHISRVTHVYNFDLPDEPANYVHRIGRTARAGARGSAVSLVCDDYGQNLADINKMLGSAYSVQSTWFNEDYLKIEDKAGNPFETRERARREAERERERDEDMGRTRDRGPRPDRAGATGRGDRGGDRPERGPRMDGGGQGRPGGNGAAEPVELGPDGQPLKKKRRRRRRRGKGQGEGTQPQQDRDQQQARGGGGGGRQQDRGRGGDQRGRDQGRGRDQHSRHPQSRHGGRSQLPVSQPTSFFGMLKRLFLSIFRRKKQD